MDDMPDMSMIEKISATKPQPVDNSFYVNNPGFMDSDKLINKISLNKSKRVNNFRFAQTNSPIDNDYLNPDAGSTDPMKPGEHYETIRRRGVSNGVVLNNRRRTVNFEDGILSEMYLELRKD